jgi:hypothetical protein
MDWPRLSTTLWVNRQASVLLLIFVVMPLSILAVFLPSDVAHAIIYVAITPLALTLLVTYLPFVGIGAGLLARLEHILNKMCRIEEISLGSSEKTRLVGYEMTGKWWHRSGRLTLTNRRLVFQRPWYRFLPPWHAGPVTEINVSSIRGVDADARVSCLGLLRPSAPFPRLRIETRDGRTYEFTSMMARAWRRYILRARREGLAQSTHS